MFKPLPGWLESHLQLIHKLYPWLPQELFDRALLLFDYWFERIGEAWVFMESDGSLGTGWYVEGLTISVHVHLDEVYMASWFADLNATDYSCDQWDECAQGEDVVQAVLDAHEAARRTYF